MTGKLLAIIIGATLEGTLHSVDSARAVPGSGLEGDRYFNPSNSEPGRDLTLIEFESLQALEAETGIHLELNQQRRNLVTQGVRLNPLIGRTFRIGEVTARGVRLCNPCQHLEDLTQPGVLVGLIERAGLRADILTQGTIHAGDSIVILDD